MASKGIYGRGRRLATPNYCQSHRATNGGHNWQLPKVYPDSQQHLQTTLTHSPSTSRLSQCSYYHPLTLSPAVHCARDPSSPCSSTSDLAPGPGSNLTMLSQICLRAHNPSRSITPSLDRYCWSQRQAEQDKTCGIRRTHVAGALAVGAAVAPGPIIPHSIAVGPR